MATGTDQSSQQTQAAGQVQASTQAQTAAQNQTVPQDRWIDKTHSFVYDTLWRSAMGLDRYFGSEEAPNVYQRIYGSLAPALLWDQFRGVQPKLRFQVNVPLPELDNRFNAVIGRFNPDEFISERAEQSGAIPRQFGPSGDDETVLGLAYRDRLPGVNGFGFGAGIRIRSPLDPYMKTDYTYYHGSAQDLLTTLRETVFWQESEHLGFTTRIDVNHFLSEQSLLQMTGSASITQRTPGVTGYVAFNLLHLLAPRRAVVGNLSVDWQTGAPVVLHEFGGTVAYRQSIYREWLILELRSSLTWPKEFVDVPRTRSWGVGIGLEMLFGTTRFQARPVTF
jgi:hypothetical protein